MPPRDSSNPRLWIAEGLLNKGNWVRDADTSQIDLNLFKRWFVERKLFAPHASVWNFGRGRLVILGVFMDYDLCETMAKGCDQVTTVVKRARDELGKN